MRTRNTKETTKVENIHKNTINYKSLKRSHSLMEERQFAELEIQVRSLVGSPRRRKLRLLRPRGIGTTCTTLPPPLSYKKKNCLTCFSDFVGGQIFRLLRPRGIGTTCTTLPPPLSYKKKNYLACFSDFVGGQKLRCFFFEKKLNLLLALSPFNSSFLF